MARKKPLPATHRELLDLLPDWGCVARDRRATIRLIEARDALATAEQELRTAVSEAYDAGDSWLTIGVILGVSRQAAQQRFRRPAPSDGRSTGPVRSERLELSLAAT
jgi:hypothetical protein